MNPSVGDIMTGPPVTVGPEESVARAAALMERERVGGLPVVEDGRLVGIIISRDVRRAHPNRLVADVMTGEVVSVPPGTTLWEARELLERRGIERLVVVDDAGAPVGVVTKAALLAELSKHVDALTGLPGASHLRCEAARLLEEGREISVIFLDLDNFGAIDKELGHARGDEVLRVVARVLRDAVGEGEGLLARYGGDEFAVVTDRPREEAKRLAERLIRALAEAEWPAGLKVTASAGVAGGRRTGGRDQGTAAETVANLVNMASLASTAAKRAGAGVLVADQVSLCVASA